jgi:hypothetical protein
MPILRIVITAPLPEDNRTAMQMRHMIEGAVLDALKGDEFKSATITLLEAEVPDRVFCRACWPWWREVAA